MNNPAELSQNTIRHKLSRKMTLQACLIALVAVLGISSASVIIEQFLVREALKSEAVHFWKIYQLDPNVSAPHTANLKGYLSDTQSRVGIPQELKGFGLGYHKMHGQTSHSLLYTTERNGKRLHLLFDGKSVLRLAIYFGVFPLTLVLVMIYLTAWWVYRGSNALLSPIIWLAHKFDRFDPAHPDSDLTDLSDIPGDIDWEIETLVTSFSSYSTRIRLFVERERAFTRDASHEFRTPLTVIKMASDLLLDESDLNKYSHKYATRIKGAARDMEELIDAFLVLARETDKEFEHEYILVRDLVDREINLASIYLDGKDINVQVVEEFSLELMSAQKVLSIVLGNLIRNAVLYTQEGKVTITIRENSVVITDTGIGMDGEQLKRIFQPYYRADNENKTKRKGYGVGLTIVRRLSNRFNWKVDVQSEVNVGTRVELIFNDKVLLS
ncbi:MAG: signal transduction histidine kinase [Arenicella sp.]